MPRKTNSISYYLFGYMGKECHITALVIIRINTVCALITHGEDGGVSQVYSVQHDAGDGEDCSSDVHEHSEAQLRGKDLLPTQDLIVFFLFQLRHIITDQSQRRELSGQNGQDSSYNDLMRDQHIIK